MRPRTKLQCEVLWLSRQLATIESIITRWAAEKCLDHIGYMTKTRVVCMDCGERFSPEAVRRKRAVCPHCGAKLRIEPSRKTTMEQCCYPAYAEVVWRHESEGEAFQVIRYFELRAYHKAGERAQYYCEEILQHWIREDGKVTKVGKNHCLNWNIDVWSGPMEIREHRKRAAWFGEPDKYDVYPCAYHPQSEFRAEYMKHGIDCKLRGLSFLEAMEAIPNRPKAETLLKAGWYGMLAHCQNSYWGKLERHWPSVRICLRQKYKPKDAGIWFDYIELLEHFGKDTRNAHYVCPKNLKKEHDRLVKRKRKQQEAEEKERKRLRARKEEEAYRKHIGRFLGLEFGDEEIRVRPLESVDEFMREGDAMHHCVFTNGYYKKKDCLILTARTQKDGRLETVEVNLENLKVVQCRGKFNKETPYHDRIIRLVERNREKIKQLTSLPQAPPEEGM